MHQYDKAHARRMKHQSGIISISCDNRTSGYSAQPNLKLLHQANPSSFKSMSHMLANRCTATPLAKTKQFNSRFFLQTQGKLASGVCSQWPPSN